MWAKLCKNGLIFFLLAFFVIPFSLKKVEGQEPEVRKLTLSELREMIREAKGKVVLIDFWATTSPASRHAMPFFDTLYASYKDKGLVVLGITVEGVGEEVVKPFVKMMGVKYPIFIGGDDIIEAYDIQYVPVTYLLDKEGKIGLKELGFTKETPNKLKKRVEELIKAGQ
ncbi:MAG TPA: TlpA disulfide reductase family protein [Candidatus Hypogeohydataceae bacterium YC41]